MTELTLYEDDFGYIIRMYQQVQIREAKNKAKIFYLTEVQT